jgi:ParB family chromosome partitioning protein
LEFLRIIMARFEYLDTEAINVEEGIRQIIDREPLDELVTSIKQHGILQPILVETAEEGRYKLQIGRRRVAAARIIGLEKVPALVLDDQLEAEKSIAIMLVENLHREDLDPIDEAEAYATLKDMGTKVSAIARLVGKERTYVSHSLRLLRLHPSVREAVRQRTIPREHALTLLRLESEQQIALAEEVMEKGLTTAETREKVRNLLGKELKWRLVPIRLEPAVYDRLAQIAPDGDVSKLLKQAVEKLYSEMNPSTIESFT